MKSYKKHIAIWIEELRSGKYKQAQYHLNPSKGEFCCLGVACKIFIPQNKIRTKKGNNLIYGVRPVDQKRSPKWLSKIDVDFERLVGISLIRLNDNGIFMSQYERLGLKGLSLHEHNSRFAMERFTFDEIADLLQLIYLENCMG